MSAGELRELGVLAPRQDRFDAVLLRALAGTGAQLEIIPDTDEHHVTGGIGALLRYTDPATPAP